MSTAVALSPAECNDQIVRNGIATFLDVGEALSRIHHEKQYRELGFKSFDAYCQDAAGHGARWGYRLMVAAKSVTNWSQSDGSPPTNEHQARVRGSALNAALAVLPASKPLPIRGEIVYDDAPEIVWEAGDTVKAYLGRVREFESLTARLLDEPSAQSEFDLTACDLTIKALAETQTKMRVLALALKARKGQLR